METNFKLLLATDYSTAVMNAERYAVQLAKATNSDLSIIHAYEPFLMSSEVPIDVVKIEREQRKQEEQKLKEHCTEILKSFNISFENSTVDFVLEEGKASTVVAEEAKESDNDFVIIGTHGVSGFTDKIFGSNTWKIIKKSTVPVLTIPPDALYTGWKNIVFATEYREGEIPVINFLSQFAKQFDARLYVVHVANGFITKEIERKLFDKFRKEIRDKISYPKISFQIINQTEITEGLNRFCIENAIDLLVLSPEKRNIFELIFNPFSSITKRMTYQTKIPLMTIPDYFNPETEGFWRMFKEEYEMVNEEF